MATKIGHDRRGVLVLAGGGVDSTVCIYQLTQEGYRVRALHVDYGQRACALEWESVKRTSGDLLLDADQVSITPGVRSGDPEVMGRNAALISIGLLQARPSEALICVGIHAGTPFFDCSAGFVDAIGRLVAEQSDSRIRLIAPLLVLTKPEVVDLARKLGVPLAGTYSCQAGCQPPCGRCHSCLDRKVLGC